jgi:hypothetical protein
MFLSISLNNSCDHYGMELLYHVTVFHFSLKYPCLPLMAVLIMMCTGNNDLDVTSSAQRVARTVNTYGWAVPTSQRFFNLHTLTYYSIINAGNVHLSG